MINTTYSVFQRSSIMFINGCKGSINEISLLPQIFYQTIYEVPGELPGIIKSSPVILIALIPLCLYDQEFGLFILNAFVIDPMKGLYSLVFDSLHTFPVAARQLMLLSAVSIGSLAVGILLGITIRVVIAGFYGFSKGVIQGYYK